jgi:cold shock CspA family protein
MFDKLLRDEEVDSHYRTYKAHLYLAFRYVVTTDVIRLVKSRALDGQMRLFISALNEKAFPAHAQKAISIFGKTYDQWLSNGGSKFGIKDNKEFTGLLIMNLKGYSEIAPTQPEVHSGYERKQEGVILRILWRNGVWFGFIRRNLAGENVYFDSRSYRGESRELIPNRKVRFEVSSNERGPYARNLSVCD